VRSPELAIASRVRGCDRLLQVSAPAVTQVLRHAGDACALAQEVTLHQYAVQIGAGNRRGDLQLLVRRCTMSNRGSKTSTFDCHSNSQSCVGLGNLDHAVYVGRRFPSEAVVLRRADFAELVCKRALSIRGLDRTTLDPFGIIGGKRVDLILVFECPLERLRAFLGKQVESDLRAGLAQALDRFADCRRVRARSSAWRVETKIPERYAGHRSARDTVEFNLDVVRRIVEFDNWLHSPATEVDCRGLERSADRRARLERADKLSAERARRALRDHTWTSIKSHIAL
jgi:hypothetical protein